MLSKYECSSKFLESDNILLCPLCKSKFNLGNHNLICENNHSFNISKKGTTILLGNNHYKESKIYNYDLFYNRRKFINEMFYKILYDKIKEIINKENITIVDLGCGEGAHTINILNNLKNYKYYGFDYSKIAIDLASDYNNENRFYFVSDVNNIPIKSNSVDVVLDILSPYNEKEIKRILKNDGLFIKVSPNKKYLKEIRKDIGSYENNVEVEDNFKKNFKTYEKYIVTQTLPLTKENFVYLANMTPINKENLNYSKSITIDLIIYVVRG